jgi:hypothetical protein
VAGADHHDELPGRIALREGRDVTTPRRRVSRRRWRCPCFSPRRRVLSPLP